MIGGLACNLAYSIKGRSNWHPSKKILSVTDDQGILHCLNVVSHKQKAFGISDCYILGATWSPDGKLLALILQKMQGGAYSVRIVDGPSVD